jgi:general L-amino acid transport system substrate-binding protein
MQRKRFALASLFMIAAMLLTACGAEEVATETTPLIQDTPAGVQPTTDTSTEATAEATAEQPAATEVPQTGTQATQPATGGVALPTGYGEITNRVKARGTLLCGARTDLPGFGYLDASGNNVGFDVDLCRAVAAAVLGDPNAVEIVPIGTAERGPALQTGEIDILSRNTTWTSSRDAQWGNFVQTMFYDGQGFIVPTDSGITTIEQLDGATVCVTSGTTTELNLADAFRQRGLEFTPLTFEDTATVYSSYEEGRCDAATSDKSQLAAVRSGFADPEAHTILEITISKEPLGPAVPSGDDQWFDIVKAVMWSIINAEELGIDSTNIDQAATNESVEVRRLVGAEGSWGQADLGLPNDVVVQIIKAVGNYGELYNRYMGPEGDSFTLGRGLNELWSNGGILYAPPQR